MENPETWTKAEHIVHQAILDAEEAYRNGVVGWSRAKRITEALRKEGLLNEST